MLNGCGEGRELQWQTLTFKCPVGHVIKFSMNYIYAFLQGWRTEHVCSLNTVSHNQHRSAGFAPAVVFSTPTHIQCIQVGHGNRALAISP